MSCVMGKISDCSLHLIKIAYCKNRLQIVYLSLKIKIKNTYKKSLPYHSNVGYWFFFKINSCLYFVCI